MGFVMPAQRQSSNSSPSSLSPTLPFGAGLSTPALQTEGLAGLPDSNLPALAVAQARSSRLPLPFRLMRLLEISEDKISLHRQALANVFSTLQGSGCACVYVVAGSPQGVRIHFGVAATDENADIADAAELLRRSFEGNFPGARLAAIHDDDAAAMQSLFEPLNRFGFVTGVPSLNASQPGEEDGVQGLERLAGSLPDATWQLVIVAEPGSDAEISQAQSAIHDMASDMSQQLRQSAQSSENFSYQISHSDGTNTSRSKGTNESDTRGKSRGVSTNDSSGSGSSSSSKGTNDGTSENKTTGTSTSDSSGTSRSSSHGGSFGSGYTLNHERTNKHVESMLKYVDETLGARFGRGRAKGMYRTAIYLGADSKATWQRLASSVASIFQGNQPSLTPLRAHLLPDGMQPARLNDLLQLWPLKPGLAARDAAFHSLPALPDGTPQAATWLNGEELSLIAGLPAGELHGLRVRKSVDFALNTAASLRTGAAPEGRTLQLGRIVQHGRELAAAVTLPLHELGKHVFITGVTGAGKTTTCLRLLMDSNLPFMVIEPAKTEYRALHGQDANKPIDYYCLGREDLTPFRLNPFELLSPRHKLSGHIDTLKATLTAIFPMEAAMPQIVGEAILKAYEAKGWSVHDSRNCLFDDPDNGPFAPGSNAWPTFSDLIAQLRGVIQSKGMGKEFEEKYEGSLVARLSDLTLGVKGIMLNTPRSMNFDDLLDRRVVFELDEIRDGQDKALLMGLILGRMTECVRLRHAQNPGFRHLTLVEEAHRLLSRPEPGEGGARKLGVEMFANLLAEVRKYGEGLIIADQIPNKLVPDVIKNTNTKIVHRLFAADDRHAIGDAIGLSDEQKAFLPMLQPGETVIYCGGWHAPVRMQVAQGASTSGNGPDEAHIRQQGQRQYWQQRHRLLPGLMASPAAGCLQTPALLTGFVQDAAAMLRHLAALSRKTASSEERRRESMRRALLHLRSQWMDAGMSEAALAEALCHVLRDTVAPPDLSADEDFELLPPRVQQGLARLETSLQAFEQYAHGMGGEHAFRYLAAIATL